MRQYKTLAHFRENTFLKQRFNKRLLHQLQVDKTSSLSSFVSVLRVCGSGFVLFN